TPNLPTLIDQNAAATPMMTELQGGPAPYGLLLEDGISTGTAQILNPPSDTVGVVMRLNPNDLGTSYTNHDFLIFTSVKPGLSLESPAWNAINPDDAAAAQPGVLLPYHG